MRRMGSIIVPLIIKKAIKLIRYYFDKYGQIMYYDDETGKHMTVKECYES